MNDKTEVPRIKDEAEYLGWVRLPTLIMYDRRLSPIQKILWSILRRYARQEEFCFPGVKKIAKGLGLTERAIQTNLGKLEELGLITRKFRTGRSTLYEFEHLHDVYCGKDRQLTDDVVGMLREAGEDRVADVILARREGNDSAAVSELGDRPEPEEVGDESVASGEEPPVTIFDKIRENQARSDAATDKRRKNQHKLAKGPPKKKAKVGRGEDGSDDVVLTVKDVEEAFRVSAQEAWPDNPATWAPWDVKNKSIAKNLCKRFGHELTIKVLETVVEQWEDYSTRFDLDGYPNVKLVAGFAETWFPEIGSGKIIDPGPKTVREKRRTREEREYQDDATGTDGGGGVQFF